MAFSWDRDQQINKLFNVWDTHMDLYREETYFQFYHGTNMFS